jgi:hypothetical protein
MTMSMKRWIEEARASKICGRGKILEKRDQLEYQEQSEEKRSYDEDE